MTGSRLALQLAKSGHSIVTAGRSHDDDIRLDLSARSVAFAGSFDALVHCAAAFEGDDLESAAENEIANAVGSLRVAQLARHGHCKHVILISTISALPENAGQSSYGLSKRHGQECLQWACGREGMRFTALQPSQLFDEFGLARRHQPLLYHIVDCAQAGRDFPLYGTKNPVRNYLYVQDLVNIIESALQRSICGCFPVVHPQSLPVGEIAETAFRLCGKGGRVVKRPDMPDMAEVFFPCDSRIYELTEVGLPLALDAGIRLIAEHAAGAVLSGTGAAR
jgi:nucleoside-diphosphate-sugar epimerase